MHGPTNIRFSKQFILLFRYDFIDDSTADTVLIRSSFGACHRGYNSFPCQRMTLVMTVVPTGGK
jgi:hypothetical protein